MRLPEEEKGMRTRLPQFPSFRHLSGRAATMLTEGELQAMRLERGEGREAPVDTRRGGENRRPYPLATIS